jgi:hypothetical protein
MSIHSRFSSFGALAAILALGAAPGLWAQDTAAARRDTSGYQGYQPQADSAQAAATDTGKTDTSNVSKPGAEGYKYTGAPTDTALKAKPGTQTGPAKNDTSGAASQQRQSRTVVCKDGSSDSTATAEACAQHGGVDSVATKAALKARGEMPAADTSKDTTTSPR